jgi:hypothetical protein
MQTAIDARFGRGDSDLVRGSASTYDRWKVDHLDEDSTEKGRVAW